MKKYFIWVVLMMFSTACKKNNETAFPFSPIPGFELVKIKVTGKVTQTISGLPVPKDAITIDLYEESNNFLVSTKTDANGNYSLIYEGLGASPNPELYIRIDQPWQAWPDINYLPSYHVENLGRGTEHNRNFELESLAYLKARFVNRGVTPVNNLQLSYGTFEKPAPTNPNEFRLFAMVGNTPQRLWCRYTQNGVNFSEPLDFNIAGYDTLTQVIYYGQP